MRAVIVIALLGAVAHAEPAHYLQGDGSVGIAAPVAGFNAMLGVEGGLRVAPYVWAHGDVGGGLAGDDQGTGTNFQLRGGAETHLCASPWLCGIVGLDLGFQRGTWASRMDMSTEVTNALVAIPRLAADIGLGAHTRLRVGLELDRSLTGENMTGVRIAGHSTLIGAELFTGIAYTW